MRKYFFFIIFAIFLYGCGNECSNLGYNECFENEDCYAVYNRFLCMDCTEEELFEECKLLPKELVRKQFEQKQLCDDTGGEWRRREIVEPGYCICQSGTEELFDIGNYQFVSERGCIPSKQLCSEYGGIWIESLPCDKYFLEKNLNSTTGCSSYDKVPPSCYCPLDDAHHEMGQISTITQEQCARKTEP